MEFPFEGLDKEKAYKFINYLVAGFGDARIVGGRASSTPAGPYHSEMTVEHVIDGRSVALLWSYTLDASGALLRVSVRSPDPEIAESVYTEFAGELFYRVLLSALAEKTHKFFERTILYHVGPQLSGEYWFGDVRIAPAYPPNHLATSSNVEQVLHIDQEVDAIDAPLAGAIARDRARQLAARFGLLLGIGIYEPLHNIYWGRPLTASGPSGRVVLAYESAEPTPTEMPSKPRNRDSYGDLGGSAAELRGEPFTNEARLLCFPREARKLLRSVDMASPSLRDAFDAAARLYQVAMVAGARFQTVQLAHQVAAAESIALKTARQAPADDKSITRAFSAFMRKYVDDFTHLDLWLGRLYSEVRSSHFHTGMFPLGDFTTTLPFHTHGRDEAQRAAGLGGFGHRLTRTAILRWALDAFEVASAQ